MLRQLAAYGHMMNCKARFQHDVVDVFLCMYTNGKVTEDKVGPHRDLVDEFPYVGPPH